LSLTTAAALAAPGSCAGPRIAASASLREALSELLWSGSEAGLVIEADGSPRGIVTVAAILAHGRPA